ncbi:MAG: S-methyl-5-thioribose-1-phosphate isomerase [Planctomycetes bacterium]|nr:S-methyl-5-thioribose-1-phosphate isomerase [Planctomycetota bacterium]
MTKPDSASLPATLYGVRWEGGLDDGHLVLLDQTRLPKDVVYLQVRDIEVLRTAICDLAVRGAPAIGIAGAFGIVLHLVPLAKAAKATTASALDTAYAHAHERLVSSRPTAVNLRWALERMRDCFDRHSSHLTPLEMCARLLMEAKRIHREDLELCRRIAENGAPLMPQGGGVYTHCNTGALATGGVGTALGCLVEAHNRGRKIQVFSGETRPLLQGARLTALELQHAKVPVTLCCDSAAASLMARGKIQAVIVGADRICANGDTANKIGTYSLAVLAKHHGIPFYVAAPYSTFDLSLADGSLIHIEERHADEVRRPHGVQMSPIDVPVSNPAFDVTPAALITAIVTERGVIDHPTRERVAALMRDQASEPAV